MGPTASPRRARVAMLAASLWTCVSLSCAHAEEAPASAEAAVATKAALASEPAAPAPASPKAGSAPACVDATGGKPPSFRWPVPGPVTSAFGMRGGKMHEGIDISSRSGMVVRAAAAGTVVFSDRKPGYGRVLVLKHAGGFETVYAHNQDNLVRRGVRVEQGQLIADMGETGEASGPHLHFEIRVGARPLDPLACLPARAKAR